MEPRMYVIFVFPNSLASLTSFDANQGSCFPALPTKDLKNFSALMKDNNVQKFLVTTDMRHAWNLLVFPFPKSLVAIQLNASLDSLNRSFHFYSWPFVNKN